MILQENQPQNFSSYSQFIADCHNSSLPEYSFIEPCHNDHPDPDGGEIFASDQHPDRNVQEGEVFMASVYNAIRANPVIWESTLLLIVYDEHGGIYDHVPPRDARPTVIQRNRRTRELERRSVLTACGVRVPAILVSPFIPKNPISALTCDQKPAF